jgi:primosomal protein N''
MSYEIMKRVFIIRRYDGVEMTGNCSKLLAKRQFEFFFRAKAAESREREMLASKTKPQSEQKTLQHSIETLEARQTCHEMKTF